jgi:hypothetical protein
MLIDAETPVTALFVIFTCGTGVAFPLKVPALEL